MKQEQVIELAYKCGIFTKQDGDLIARSNTDHLARFASLVEKATLERAAAIARNCELHDGDFLKNSDPRETISQMLFNLAKESR